MRPPPLLLSVLLAVGGCSSHDLAGSDGRWHGDTGAEGAPAEDGDPGEGAPPSEQEDLVPALLPAQTDVHVFIANPARDTVTRVNVFSLEVRTVPVGRDPRIVVTTPDHQTAVVFNRGDDTVTLIDALTLDTERVEVRANFNNLVLSPGGEWAAVWHDRNRVRPDDPEPQGMQSYNEVSFVHVPTGDHFPMAVGFNPRQIQFTGDDSLGVVVSDEYLALVDLTADTPSPTLVQVAEDLVDPPVAEEVALSGDRAFVRQLGTSDLVVVDLLTYGVDRLPVGINPTDLDLTPDGQRVVVISRDSGEVHLFDAEDPFADPDVLTLPEDIVVGSVRMAPSGDTAILYTTGFLQSRYATWDLATDEITVRSLVKPVAGMAVTPTGGSLLVFHTEDDAPDADPSSPFAGHWAMTLIDLEDFRSNPLRLPAEPIGFANAASGQRGYFIMEGEPYLEVLHYDTLLYDEYLLRSEPVFVGVLPDLDPGDGVEPPAWVSQEHPLGRISFLDPDVGSLQTITGFELNAHIEED